MLSPSCRQYCSPSAATPQQSMETLQSQGGESTQQQQQQPRRSRPVAMWQGQQGGREVSQHHARIQQQQRQSPVTEQQQNNSSAVSGTSHNETNASDGRNLLRSLTFHRVLYVSEAFTNKRYNAGSNMLRKNYENFVLLKHKQALVTPGPKKAKDFPRGLVIAYPSGHIISAATRQHFVGLAPQPDFFGGALGKTPATNNPRDGVQMYADWIRRKFRSHETEPPCATNGHTRFLNFLTRADLPQPPHPSEPLEVFLEEFHDFLRLHFPHWSVVYDPEVSPVMAICRAQKGTKPADAVAAAAAAAAAAANLQNQSQVTSVETSPGQRKQQRVSLDPPAKLQRCSNESASAASNSGADVPWDSSGYKPMCAPGRLILPVSQQPKHLWPPASKIVAYCRKEWAVACTAASSPGSAEAAAAQAELHVVLLIGAAHIVAHCRSSGTIAGEGNADCIAETNYCQAATSAAVSDIWSLFRHFVGTSRERFSV